jgi:hypothetical protein
LKKRRLDEYETLESDGQEFQMIRFFRVTVCRTCAGFLSEPFHFEGEAFSFGFLIHRPHLSKFQSPARGKFNFRAQRTSLLPLPYTNVEMKRCSLEPACFAVHLVLISLNSDDSLILYRIFIEIQSTGEKNNKIIK